MPYSVGQKTCSREHTLRERVSEWTSSSARDSSTCIVVTGLWASHRVVRSALSSSSRSNLHCRRLFDGVRGGLSVVHPVNFSKARSNARRFVSRRHSGEQTSLHATARDNSELNLVLIHSACCHVLGNACESLILLVCLLCHALHHRD